LLFGAEIVFRHLLFRGKLGFVSDIFSPSVSWNSPRTISFNVEVVDSSDESKGSSFSPVGPPRIPDDPILSPVFFSPTSDTNIVIKFNSSSLINEDARSIVSKVVSNCDSASDWSSLVDLIHHISFSLQSTIFLDSIDLGSLLGPAASVRHAVLALDHSRAAYSVIVSVSLIWRASFISDVVVVDPFISVLGVTSITAVIGGFT
jgi:hypothetical protein